VPNGARGGRVGVEQPHSYLGDEERRAATVLFRSLTAARDAYEHGERNADALRAAMNRFWTRNHWLRSIIWPPRIPDSGGSGSRENGVLLSLAVRIGGTRLIDNLLLPGDDYVARD